jgi:hypothetical protein
LTTTQGRYTFDPALGGGIVRLLPCFTILNLLSPALATVQAVYGSIVGTVVDPYGLQFRFEAFNFPNHPNWDNPNANKASNPFGQITGTCNNMRNLQLALKFLF